jgi:hypothetical protein
VQTDLEALVLQHSLDRSIFSARRELGLKDHAEGAIADNLALRVGQILIFTSLAVLDLFADNFCASISKQHAESSFGNLPPILKDEKADGRFWLIVWGNATRGGSGRHCADCYREKGGLSLRRVWAMNRGEMRKSVLGGKIVGMRCYGGESEGGRVRCECADDDVGRVAEANEAGATCLQGSKCRKRTRRGIRQVNGN